MVSAASPVVLSVIVKPFNCSSLGFKWNSEGSKVESWHLRLHEGDTMNRRGAFRTALGCLICFLVVGCNRPQAKLTIEEVGPVVNCQKIVICDRVLTVTPLSDWEGEKGRTVVRRHLTESENAALVKVIQRAHVEKLDAEYDGGWTDGFVLIFTFDPDSNKPERIRVDTMLVEELADITEVVDNLIPERYRIHYRLNLPPPTSP